MATCVFAACLALSAYAEDKAPAAVPASGSVATTAPAVEKAVAQKTEKKVSAAKPVITSTKKVALKKKGGVKKIEKKDVKPAVAKSESVPSTPDATKKGV